MFTTDLYWINIYIDLRCNNLLTACVIACSFGDRIHSDLWVGAVDVLQCTAI